jgi:hypothetical protein
VVTVGMCEDLPLEGWWPGYTWAILTRHPAGRGGLHEHILQTGRGEGGLCVRVLMRGGGVPHISLSETHPKGRQLGGVWAKVTPSKAEFAQMHDQIPEFNPGKGGGCRQILVLGYVSVS